MQNLFSWYKYHVAIPLHRYILLTSVLFVLLTIPTTVFLLQQYHATHSHAAASSSGTAATPTSSCGLTNPAFCDTFDQPMGTGNRSGDLNGTVWGVSRTGGTQNLGQGLQNAWAIPSHVTGCGSTQTVQPENDIKICNGQVFESMNDGGVVTALTMYPKQPFDFAGRTGKVTFDVSDDSQGNHAAWPEFWITDKPVPGPFTHETSWKSFPQNGFGIRFARACTPGQGGNCGPNCPSTNTVPVVSVDSAVVIHNYVGNDSFSEGNLQVNGDQCVNEPRQQGQLNHFEVDVSQNQIDIYGTDAGTTGPLKHLASIPNTNLGFSRGLIWMEDVHYNANKFNTQADHTFIWDNVGFDGPILPRDLAFDANDALTPEGSLSLNGDKQINLGWITSTSSPKTVTIPNLSGIANASAGLLEFNFYSYDAPLTFHYSLNGNTTHTYSWPFPDTLGFSPRTIAIPVSLSEVVNGTNTVKVWADNAMNVFNFDLVMVAAGGIPCNINPSQPCNGTPIPTANVTVTPRPSTIISPTLTPQPTPTPKPLSSGCGLTNPAFCDDLSEGAKPGGRAGDLDESKWSISRIVGQTSSSDLIKFSQTPVSACKSGVSSVNVDNDVLVCDSASGHKGQFLTAMSAQNYALVSMRPRQMFDFTKRTGTISWNTDAFTQGGLGWWTSLYVTDDPVQGGANTLQVTGLTPKNGLGVNFDGNNCGGTNDGSQMRINDVFVYTDYAESIVPVDNGVCVKTKRGSLNHLEIKLSQTSIQIWASDFSSDNDQTFPNFKMIGSAAINLPFSQGYVHFQQNERAPIKYSFNPTYSNNYWSDLGFDGPVVFPETAYEVPDALTNDPNGGINIGYGLLTNPNSTMTCCSNTSQTTIAPFSLSNINLSGITSAKLSFSASYTFGDGTHTSSTIVTRYRFNSGAWKNPAPTPEYTKALNCAAWCNGGSGDANWAVGFSFPVAVSDLKNGTNTLEIASDGTWNGYPPVLANVDLLTFGSTPQPTPVVTQITTPTQSGPSPTSKPQPTNSPFPTATPIPNATKLVFSSIKLHGIGTGGDSINPNSAGNTQPVTPQRTVTISVFNANNTQVTTGTGTIRYNSTSGDFAGTVSLSTAVPTGPYSVKIKTDKYLTKLLPGIQTIMQTQSNTMPLVTLVAGDINNDNQINILDYNILIGCYSDFASPKTCTPVQKQAADLTDDGQVNQFDYNLFLREMLNRQGD